MDDIARLPAADRADLFVVTGTGRGLTAEMIEKDFWVCWTLKRVFTLPNPPAGLLFKGGTSLSKVFGVIERFSEDVDLSFDRAGLGFGGESDPMNATTGKRRKQGLEFDKTRRFASTESVCLLEIWPIGRLPFPPNCRIFFSTA